MMRCIDHPTMLKDGSGWGAMAGVISAYLAADGFTGAPALTVERDDVRGYMGRPRRALADPRACISSRTRYAAGDSPRSRRRFRFVSSTGSHRRRSPRSTSSRSTRRLASTNTSRRRPRRPNTAFRSPLRRRLSGVGSCRATWWNALTDQAVVALSRKIRLIDDPDLSRRFPAERFARVRVELQDGTVLESETLPARGDAETPLADTEIALKFHALADGPLGPRAQRIEELISELPETDDAATLLAALLSPLAQ